MDLESECTALESVEEDELNQETSSHDGENRTRNNGSVTKETYHLGLQGNSDTDAIIADEKGNFGRTVCEEPVCLSRGSPPATKGYGLKKWKRIRRDNIVKDPNTLLDSNKILKRGLAPPANSSKSQPFPFDVKQNSEGSVGSLNVLKNVGFTDGFAIHGSSSDSRYAAGIDSENSKDQISKSSTAASVPKLRYDLPAVVGLVSDKSLIKNISSKNLANSTQKVKQGKGQVGSSKKPRGERVKMEKENSLSSIESDSRSIKFKQGIFKVTNNGKHSGRPVMFDGGNNDEAHTTEHFLEENQADYCKDNMGEDEDHLQDDLAANLSWNVKEEKSENNQPSKVGDPFIESIWSLMSVQEMLEDEVQKLRETGNEPLSPGHDSVKSSSAAAGITSVDPEFYSSFLYGQTYVEGIKETASSSLELQVLSLTRNVYILESKLEESRGILALKDSKIAELEVLLRSGKFPQEESGSTAGLEEEKYMEAELEGLFRQKIEAEVEYLAITKMMGNLIAADLQKGQETVSGKQAQVLNKIVETENKASGLKNQVEELEKYSDDILEFEETLKLQKRVCNMTCYFFTQFMFLIFGFWLMVSQPSFNAGVVVPT